jgi:hypothetical protein
MNARLLTTALLALGFASVTRAADDETEKKPSVKDAMRAQLIEDAKKAPSPKPAPTSATATAPKPGAPPPPPAPPPATPTRSATPATPAAAGTTPAKPGDPATVLPQVEVNRTKPTELGRQLYEKDREIAREKPLTKSTELDKALNSPKVTIPILGGQSTASRESVASERVSLLQEERDLLEEIAHAKTKAEKQELQKELEEIRKVRRELEHAIR